MVFAQHAFAPSHGGAFLLPRRPSNFPPRPPRAAAGPAARPAWVGEGPSCNARPGRRGEPEFRGVTNHVAGRLSCDEQQRALLRAAAGASDDQTAGYRVTIGHRLERLERCAPMLKGLAVG